MIQLHWKNATDEAVSAEHGITRQDLESVHEGMVEIHGRVREQARSGLLGYAKLPQRSDYRQQVRTLVDRYRDNTTDLVVLGIGGSALGNIAIQSALNPGNYNLLSDRRRGGPRLFVLDNVDPALIDDVLRLIGRRLKTTLVNVISKSGETAETASEFMIFREKLRSKLGESFAERIVATTDANKGTLHDIAARDGYATLPVPDDVGGRFSVLSPVGLFSAAMCGVDIDALLAGASEMKKRVEHPEWMANPACVLAAIKFLACARKNKPMHVMMPYSNRLYLLADWYRQLWAESLGKKVDRNGQAIYAGPTPIKALGTTDQHSQVQLYREGPNDKLTVFLQVDKHPADVKIPDVFGEVGGLAYLRKAKLSKLLNAEKLATEYALAVSNRPSVTLRFDRITPASVGEFFYLYEYTTSLMGELLEINAYDQPAVELGKQATFALMGKEGDVAAASARDLGRDSMTYKELATEIKPFAKPDDRYTA